jgi:hypothetical protein
METRARTKRRMQQGSRPGKLVWVSTFVFLRILMIDQSYNHGKTVILSHSLILLLIFRRPWYSIPRRSQGSRGDSTSWQRPLYRFRHSRSCWGCCRGWSRRRGRIVRGRRFVGSPRGVFGSWSHHKNT